MKTIKYIIGIFAIILFSNTWAVGQNSLKQEVIKFIGDYEQYGSFSKDGLVYEASYKVEFSKLFEQRPKSEQVKKTQVFNDLVSSPQAPYISLSDYIYNLKTTFPKGLNIKMNILEIGEPKKAKGGVYKQVDVQLKKSIFGLTEYEKIYKSEVQMTFRILYKEYGGEISDLKIYWITSEEFPREPSGMSMGINIQPSYTRLITDGFLNSENEYGTWSETGNAAFSGGLELNYYFESIPFLGFGMRINYTSYQSSIKLNKITKQQYLNKTDSDSDEYLLVATGNNFTEDVKLTFIEIPLFAKFRLPVYKIKFVNQLYVNLGPVFSFGANRTSTTNGNYTYKGIYENYNVELFNIEYYGFYTDKEFSGETELATNSMNISILAELGANIPLSGKKISMNISLIYQKGIANLSEGNESYYFTEGYDSNKSLLGSRSKINTNLFGLNIGILYKLF